MALEAAVMEAEPPPYLMSGREQEGTRSVEGTGRLWHLTFLVENTNAQGEDLAQWYATHEMAEIQLPRSQSSRSEITFSADSKFGFPGR